MIPSDWDIRNAIRGIVAAADPEAVVLPKMVLDVTLSENPSLLKPEAGASAGRIHAWLIDRGKQRNKRLGEVRWDSKADSAPYRLEAHTDYLLKFFHFYELGDETAGTDSNRLFIDRLDRVIEYVAGKPRLSLGDQIARHEDVQLEKDPVIVPMGAEWAHMATCRLTVVHYRSSIAS